MPFDANTPQGDEELLALFARGDPHAGRLLTMRLAPSILGLAHRLLGDRSEAEDVTQEAMLRLWKIAPDWRAGEAKVSTWLYKVASNLCMDRLRKGKRAAGWPEGFDPQDDRAGALEGIQARERAAVLDQALAGLPERQRLAVTLRHLEGLANPQIAQIMDLSVEAVESLIFRGRQGLAKALAGQRETLGFTDD